jgi:parallel beta-helix repeat protein
MRALVLLVFTFFANLASATTYYVDSASGNDIWTGRQSAPVGSPATDGPWLTLAKVTAANPLPNDTILLKCGGTWNKTLSIKTSGTASNPITYGVYPTPCATPPQINGATRIPASNWKQYSGNIYKATLPLDLISNSTFDTTYGGWTQYSQYNDATLSLSSNCPSGGGNCLSFTGGTGTGNSLAISNTFELNASMAYRLNFSAKVPSGKTIRAIVRRNAPPWDQLGVVTSIAGTGAWQTYSFPFNAKVSLANARLDFEVAPGVNIGLDNVRVETTLGGALGVFDNGRAINVAHHPNRGYDPLHPDSLYYSIAQDSDRTVVSGGTVSTYVTTGSDLQLPTGATLTPGTEIRIRTYDWTLDERKIASVSGTRINLDRPTDYPLYQGWGYFLVGQLWMLDEPGEAFFDAATNAVYVWMADSKIPGDRVSISQLDVGIDINTVSHVVVDGIAIRNSGTGIRLKLANNLTLRNMVVEDVLGMGIDATQSTACDIGTSRFARTGRSAISGADAGYGLSNFSIHDNDISESGVLLNGLNGNAVTNLPADIVAAVQPGASATITGNSIRGVGYAAIRPLQNSVVSDNHIENACRVLDDGGAIYVQGLNSYTTINHNTVLHVVGAPDGKPAGHFGLAQGIYLDAGTTDVTISNNTVIDAYDGIHIHDAANNRIENNTLYGNRHYQLWMQEDRNVLRPEGDVYGNIVTGNRFFQTSSIPPVLQDTIYASTEAAASYDNNLYFTLMSGSMATEKWSTGWSTYSLHNWQSLTTSSGVPRNLDPLGSEVNSRTLGYAAYRVTGSNIVPNANFANGIKGWTSWNQTSPYGQLSLISCVPGRCLHYIAGASKGLVASPNFSVVQGQWYRLSFDLQGSTANQTFVSLMRRGGGGSNGYELLMAPQTFTATTAWQRFSLTFQSTKTINANDPVTGDLGARIDLDGTLPGQAISVTNLELVPISAFTASLHTNILVNPTAETATVDCPFTGPDAPSCSETARFSDAQHVYWPYTLGPRDSEIVYATDSALMDTDGDGIPDSQDTCASTPAGQSVNAKGCAFVQSYP